jgi:hypothetical protein
MASGMNQMGTLYAAKDTECNDGSCLKTVAVNVDGYVPGFPVVVVVAGKPNRFCRHRNLS